MKIIARNILFLCLMLLMFSSCLTVEKKEYHFELTGKESGILTIKYSNIMSVSDSEDELNKDFEELIEKYIDGNYIERDYPFACKVSKRLFEEEGKLCAEIQLSFSELSAVKLFQYEKGGCKMLSLNTETGMEKYNSSNGNYGGEIMPVVFWDDDIVALKLSTGITDPDDTSRSLLNKFYEWKKARSTD